ncbi:UNVERIFIED_CONTAM: hypothetical protein NY100_34155, partial [Prevotella sp. 15_C9]
IKANHILFLAGSLKTRQSFPAIRECPKFSSLIYPKLSFCFPKGKLLQCKRSWIGAQKLSF